MWFEHERAEAGAVLFEVIKSLKTKCGPLNASEQDSPLRTHIKVRTEFHRSFLLQKFDNVLIFCVIFL